MGSWVPIYKMKNELSRQGIEIDGVYFCPHLELENCNCRKPKPGMFFMIVGFSKYRSGAIFFVGWLSHRCFSCQSSWYSIHSTFRRALTDEMKLQCPSNNFSLLELKIPDFRERMKQNIFLAFFWDWLWTLVGQQDGTFRVDSTFSPPIEAMIQHFEGSPVTPVMASDLDQKMVTIDENRGRPASPDFANLTDPRVLPILIQFEIGTSQAISHRISLH